MDKILPLLQDDPWLKPYETEVNRRFNYYTSKLDDINDRHNSLREYSSAHKYLGFNYSEEKKGVFYR